MTVRSNFDISQLPWHALDAEPKLRGHQRLLVSCQNRRECRFVMCVDFQYAFIFTPNQNHWRRGSLLTLILIINRTAGANSIKTMGFRLNNKITEKFLKKC